MLNPNEPMFIAQKFFILSLKEGDMIPKPDIFRSQVAHSITVYLMACFVIKLLALKRIEIQEGNAVLIHDAPTERKYLNAMIAYLEGRGKTVSLEALLQNLDTGAPQRMVLETLEANDILEETEDAIIFVTPRSELIDPTNFTRSGVIHRIKARLLEDQEIKREAIGLAQLLDLAGLLEIHFSSEECEQIRLKLKEMKTQYPEIFVITDTVQKILS